MPRNEFDRLLREAIDEGFASLGESARRSIYFHLERIFGIKRSKIPGNMEAFAEALERIFGPGASFLEILIMKKLYEKTGYALKGKRLENLRFTEYIAMSRKCYQRRGSSFPLKKHP